MSAKLINILRKKAYDFAMDENPDKARLFALRSFGESFYHSITDASLEFGFKSL